jgi:hypothetical protein
MTTNYNFNINFAPINFDFLNKKRLSFTYFFNEKAYKYCWKIESDKVFMAAAKKYRSPK